MAKYIRREIRKRGFFGWLFLLLFFAFNLIMLAWLINYWSILADDTGVISDAQRTGRAIGGTIGSGLIVSIWGFGAVILGLFALLTRGSKIIVEDYGSDDELRRNIARSRREPNF